MQLQSRWWAGVAGGVLVFSLGVAGCGDDDDGGAGAAGQSATGGESSSAGAAQDAMAGAGNMQDADGGATSGGAGPTSSCRTALVGSWKAGAKRYEASGGLFVALDEKFNFTMVACDGSDAAMEFEMIPMLAEGSYPLTFTILHGKPANGDGGGVFLDPKAKNYFTDATHTGTFVITDVDDTARTFSADFAFTGRADDGDTLEITDGHIVDAAYQLPAP